MASVKPVQIPLERMLIDYYGLDEEAAKHIVGLYELLKQRKPRACRNCIHSEKTKDCPEVREDVRHCKIFRGDDCHEYNIRTGKYEDLSLVDDCGFCDEWEEKTE